MCDNNTTRSRANRKRSKPTKISYEEDEQTSQYFDKKVNWQPENWEIILDNIRKMRSGCDAPVDKMGCERCVDENESPEVSENHYSI